MPFGIGKKKAPAPKESIAKLRETVDLLEKRAVFVQKKMDKEVEMAKAFMAKKNKKGALTCLKRKKAYEAQLEKIWAQQQTVESQMMTLEDSAATVDTLSAMKTGAASMKAIHKKTKIEDVDKLMDQIQDQQEDAEEISAALTQSLGGAYVDDDELEDELAMLMGDADIEAELAALDMPSAGAADLPSKGKGKSKASTVDEDAELAALMAGM